MYGNLSIFRAASAAARDAGARQALTARNIANADTPGFRAVHLERVQSLGSPADAQSLRVTRPEHIASGREVFRSRVVDSNEEPSPNGNTVSLESEMVDAVNNQRDHDRALAVYRHAMTILRTSLGR